MGKQKVTSEKRNINWNEMAIFLVLAILVISLSIARPIFLSTDNLINVIRQVTMVAILGIGMTFVLIAGEIDLSVGSIAALAGIVVAMAMKAGISVPVSILLALLTGGCCGMLNGAIHVYARIPSFIVTMGMLNIARGAVLVITNSYPITGLPESFKIIGRGYIGPVPVPVIIMAVCYAAGYVVLKYTKFGRSTYAIGGNIEAAKLSGITVNKNKILIYLFNPL